MDKKGKSEKNRQISFMRILGLELARGLHEKRFWIVAGVVFLICIAAVGLHAVYPLTLYYRGGEEALEVWGHWPFSVYEECRAALDNSIWKIYFPFFAAAYAYSLLDDRKNGYVYQLAMKQGIRKYISVKLCAGSILGGIMGMMPVICTSVITFLGIHVNPFVQDAVRYYRREQPEGSFLLYMGGNVVAEDLSLLQWMLLGGLSWFLLGLVFGLLAGIIGSWTENKLMAYVMPVAGLQLWDIIISLLPFPGTEKLYIKTYMGFDSFGYLDWLTCVIVIMIVLVCVSVLSYPRAKYLYSEGGR